MSGDYELRPLDLTDGGLRNCEALLRRVFPRAPHLTRQYLDWQYNRNPAGKAVGFNAHLSDVLAAHYVTIPIVSRMGKDERRGLLSLNTATHPDHQGKKLFTLLAERTYEVAASLGYGFVVGVANANSTPGFVKKLGFRLVSPLDARLGLGRLTRERGDGPAVGFERLWDRDSLGWRVTNPSTGYSIVSAGSTFRVEAATERPAIKALLGEFDAALKPEGIPGTAIGFRPVTLWLGIDPQIRWSRSIYWKIPERFRRSPLNLIFKPLQPGVLAPRREEIRFRAIDFDPY